MFRKSYAFLAILVLVGAFVAIGSIPWRLALINLKLSGDLPKHTWGEIVSALRPVLFGRHSLRPLVTGDVTVAEWDPDNPCPVVWNTPVGRMHGFFEDREVLGHFLTRSWIVDPNAPKVQPGDVVLEIGA